MTRHAASLAASLLIGLAVIGLTATGCRSDDGSAATATPTAQARADATPTADPAVLDTATFAGGCFWCMEPPYDRLDGVQSTTSGFSGGPEVDPSYREVAGGQTGHTEVVQVVYDTTKVNYERLLYVYWRNVDPLDGSGQFCDRGSQYRPAIFWHDARQRRLAESTKDDVADRFEQPIQVEIEPFEAFYAAEQYHQNYYQKNPDRYSSYRQGCRRDARLEALWGNEANAPPKDKAG
jgi:peptide-methionine (S)-S-oxide reductase